MKHTFSYIVYESVSVCNLDCLYCYNIWKIPGAEFQHFNSYKDSMKTLKKLFKIADVGNIAFTGGEPLLSERFPEIVLFCRMKGTNVTIISNGNAGTPEIYKNLIDIGANFFEFPLHSHKSEVHEYLTRRIGSHAKALKSIDYVLNNKGKVVVDIVLNKQNIKEITETIKYIKSLGIDRVMITRFNIGGEGLKHQNELVPDIEDLRKAFHELGAVSEAYGMSITSNVCTPLCVLNPNDYKNITTLSCSASVDSMPLTLDIKGNMRICNHSPVYIGNIFEKKLDEIFECDYIKSWKTTVPDYCRNCDVFSNCFGGCRAASEQMGRGLTEPDPLITHA